MSFLAVERGSKRTEKRKDEPSLLQCAIWIPNLRGKKTSLSPLDKNPPRLHHFRERETSLN